MVEGSKIDHWELRGVREVKSVGIKRGKIDKWEQRGLSWIIENRKGYVDNCKQRGVIQIPGIKSNGLEE